MGGTTGDLLGTGNSGGGSFAQPMTGADYNRRLQAGESSQAIRDSQKGGFFGGAGLSDNQFNDIVTQAGMQSPTGRPLAGSAQFFQPVYQPQYNNYATTNRLGVSQYGTPMTPESLVDSAYAGIGRFGVGTGTDQMDAVGRRNHINAFQTGQYTPQNFFQGFSNSVRDYQTQNPNDRYTQYTQNQPGYMGGFTGFSGGFMPQMQQPFNPFTNSFGGGFGGGFMPQQQQFQQPMQQYNPYQQPMQQFMPQMQSPFSFQPQFQPQMNMQTPFSSGMSQPAPQRTSSGPAQAIIGRSSQMRGTPNVMRRAEGGITSLMGKA